MSNSVTYSPQIFIYFLEQILEYLFFHIFQNDSKNTVFFSTLSRAVFEHFGEHLISQLCPILTLFSNMFPLRFHNYHEQNTFGTISEHFLQSKAYSEHISHQGNCNTFKVLQVIQSASSDFSMYTGNLQCWFYGRNIYNGMIALLNIYSS